MLPEMKERQRRVLPEPQVAVQSSRIRLQRLDERVVGRQDVFEELSLQIVEHRTRVGHYVHRGYGDAFRWAVYFRVYGPVKAGFDGSWKPGDFEEVK